jgi:hypothetical protein
MCRQRGTAITGPHAQPSNSTDRAVTGRTPQQPELADPRDFASARLDHDWVNGGADLVSPPCSRSRPEPSPLTLPTSLLRRWNRRGGHWVSCLSDQDIMHLWPEPAAACAHGARVHALVDARELPSHPPCAGPGIDDHARPVAALRGETRGHAWSGVASWHVSDILKVWLETADHGPNHDPWVRNPTPSA